MLTLNLSLKFNPRVNGPPHGVVDLLDWVVQRCACQAFLLRGRGDGDCNRCRDCPQVSHRGKQWRPGCRRVGDTGHGVGGGGDHLITDPVGLGDGDTQPETRKYQGVICLCDLVGPTSVNDRREGLPVAVRTRPLVHAMRSSGNASHFEVGFDSGMMIGRSVWVAMSLTMASVNAPECVEVPINIVGWAWATTSADQSVLRRHRGPNF